jgi:predicted permease
VTLYRWLLRLLPREFRDRQGDELLATAAEQIEAAEAAGRSQTTVRIALAAEVLAAAWTLRVSAFWTGFTRDVRFAIRLLRRAPGFTAITVLTLALGIASSTTVFSIVNAFYFKPSEFPDPDRLVDVSETSATKLCSNCAVGTSYPGYEDWRARATSFESLESYLEEAVVVSGSVTPERLTAARITPRLFGVLGIAPVAGRDFARSDDRPEASLVALISHRVWQRLFAGSRDAIGRVLRVDGRPAEIVGVMPPDFRFPERADLWIPLHSRPPSLDRESREYGVVGRLRAGVTMAQARAEMTSLAASARPAGQADWSVQVRRFGDDRVGTEGQAFLMMLAAVGLVLAIACANLMALFLARGARRRRELSVRAALGAGRDRLIRQLLIESLVIGVLGGAVGLVLSYWGVALARAGLYSSEVPYYINIAVDWRVVLFAGGASLLASALVGLLPALTATRVNLVDGLKLAGASAPTQQRRQTRVRAVLIVGELALVLVLLSGAALMGRSFLRFFERPRGYDLRGLTLAQLPLGGPRFEDPGQLRTALADLAGRLDAIPSARAALQYTLFVRGFGGEPRRIRVEDLPIVPDSGSPGFAFGVTPNFFQTQGLEIVTGRGFTAADRQGTEPVVAINRAMASALWPNASAIGRRIQLRPDVPGDPWRTVVGVVNNRDGDPRPGVRLNPFVYLPLEQLPGRPVDVWLRTTGDAAPALSQIRAAIAEIDPDQPLTDVRSAEEEHRREYWYVGYFAVFYALFAAFGLLLAVIGVYGVVAQTVGERTREFGIRAALGADRRRLYRLVLGRALLLALLGAALGVLASRLSTRFLGWLLFGADPNSPLLLTGATALLIATALAASYLPARRAARVDPLVVLKAE